MICWGTFGVENILVWLNKIKFKKRKLQIIHEEEHINLNNTGLKVFVSGFTGISFNLKLQLESVRFHE